MSQVKPLWIVPQGHGLNRRFVMKNYYEEPEIEIVSFESEDIITASGDYTGIDFMELI